jgi:hypothetical protein
MPAENRSVRASSGSRRTCSGDMYGELPAGRVLVLARSSPRSSSTAAASPKSTSFTSPSRDSITLRGDRSRWMTPTPLPLRCA